MKPKLKTETIAVRNRYAYVYDVSRAYHPSLLGTVRGFKSLGGVGGFSDYGTTLVNRLHYGNTPSRPRRRINDGISATTPMSLNWTTVSSDPMSDSSLGFDFYKLDPSVAPNPVAGTTSLVGGEVLPLEVLNGTNVLLPSVFRWNDDTTLKKEPEARNRFLVNASNEADFCGAVFLGELKESRDMIHSRVKQLGNSVEDFLRRRRVVMQNNRPTLARRKIANLYLEGVFGWLPLASDIAKGYEAIRKTRENPKLRRVSSSAWTAYENRPRKGYRPPEDKWETTYDSGYKAVSVAPNISGVMRTTERGYSFCHYFGAVKPSLYGIPENHVLRQFGLNPTDVASYAWELTRLSWMADYFISIGDFLAVDWDIRSRLSWVCRVRGYECEAESVITIPYYIPVELKPAFDLSNVRTPLITNIKRKRVEREDRSAADMDFEWYFKTLHSWKQVANISAVISQLV